MKYVYWLNLNQLFATGLRRGRKKVDTPQVQIWGTLWWDFLDSGAANFCENVWPFLGFKLVEGHTGFQNYCWWRENMSFQISDWIKLFCLNWSFIQLKQIWITFIYYYNSIVLFQINRLLIIYQRYIILHLFFLFVSNIWNFWKVQYKYWVMSSFHIKPHDFSSLLPNSNEDILPWYLSVFLIFAAGSEDGGIREYSASEARFLNFLWS